MKLAMTGRNGLVFVAEVSDNLRDQGEILLRLIAGTDSDLDADDTRARVDWGIVKLVRRGEEVFVEEPDYKRDPRRFVPGLNFTSAVLRAQQLVHDRLGVSAEPVKYDQSVLVYPGGLTAANVTAIRQPPVKPDDTGWRVFDAGRIDWTADPQARRVYEIAGERQEIMSVLSLPAGWSVRLESGTLKEAAPPHGDPIAVGMLLEL